MSDSEIILDAEGCEHLRSSQPLSHGSWGLPHREKPQLIHIILGSGVTAFSYYFMLQSFRPFLAEAMTHLLSLGRIVVEKTLVFEPPTLVLRLMNGSELSLALTWQRSGLFSIIIFGLLFIFLAFPLEGSIWIKIAWLEFGSFVGLGWSFIRLSTLALVAYYFGADAFALADFVTSSLADFLWVIPFWSLGLSVMISAKRKNTDKTR